MTGERPDDEQDDDPGDGPALTGPDEEVLPEVRDDPVVDTEE